MRSGGEAVRGAFRDMMITEAPRHEKPVREKPAPRRLGTQREPLLMVGDTNLYETHNAARMVASTGRAGAYATIVVNDETVGSFDVSLARRFSPTLLGEGGTFELPKHSAGKTPFPIVVEGHIQLMKQWMQSVDEEIDPANVDAIFNNFPLPRWALPVGELEIGWIRTLAMTDCKVLLVLSVALRLQAMPFMMMRVLGEKNARLLKSPGGVERVRSEYGIDANAPEHALTKKDLRDIERDWGWA